MALQKNCLAATLYTERKGKRKNNSAKRMEANGANQTLSRGGPLGGFDSPVSDSEDNHGLFNTKRKITVGLLLFVLGVLISSPGKSIDKTWDFFDDDFQGWIVQEGDWYCEEDALVHNDELSHGGLASPPGFVFGNFTLEADVCIGDAKTGDQKVWAGMLFRASAPLEDGAWIDGYQLIARAGGRVDLIRAGGKILASAATDYLPTRQTVRLKVSAQGSVLRGYANDQELFTVEDPTFSQGGIALLNFGCLAAFDNVRVAGALLDADSSGEAVVQEIILPQAHAPVTPLPRIGVRKAQDRPGEFYNTATGARFIPKGFNHTVLEHGDSGWHATFNVGTYHAEAMEKLLTEMARLGANAIRVWAWGVQNENGFCGNRAARGLNAAYMENFLDFLRRATAHGLYVIPILDEVPRNAYFDYAARKASIEFKDDPKITAYNRQYLCRGPLAAKADGVEAFIRCVQSADPGLLSTILAWSLANEIFVNTTQGPFVQGEEEIKTSTGKSCNMAEKAQRQACYDESILYWANTLADTVKRVDPEALVTAGMWSSDAQGLAPVNGLPPDSRDPRIPPRPSVLGGAASLLDFIDVHVYPWDGTSNVCPEAHERGMVIKPGIVGEYGVFKDKTAEQARAMMAEMLDQAYAMGYTGDLQWIWDLTGVKGQTWSAVEAGIGKFLMDWPNRPQ